MAVLVIIPNAPLCLHWAEVSRAFSPKNKKNVRRL
jgi:hypothetical protein